MKQIGIVEKTENDIAVVRIKRASACGENCASCKGGCTPTEQTVTAKNTVGAKTGDNVIISLETHDVLFAAFLVYILPLIVLFAVYMICTVLKKSEVTAAVCGVFAMLFSLIAARIFDRKTENKYFPIISEVL